MSPVSDPILPAEYIQTLADGTVKQVNPFSGTQVWTVPGRADRPLEIAPAQVNPLVPTDLTSACAFCSDRYLQTPPEKDRSVLVGSAYERRFGLLPEEVTATVAAFRRIPNLFEIMSVDYWQANYGYVLSPGADVRRQRYLASPGGRDHLLAMIRRRLNHRAATMTEDELLEQAGDFFGSAHDVIVAQRHFRDGATTDDQLASSGTLTPAEHREYLDLTTSAMVDLYEENRYIRYVAVFQNWLKPAGASFDHLHKQLVGVDEHGVQTDLEVAAVRRNPNVFNERAVNYAGYHNLVIAENDNAVALAGFGHRYPSLEVWSTSPTSEPWLMTAAERHDMSDLIHAMHAATGAIVPSNEEWHHKPPDVDVAMPWHVLLKWRVSTLAGFEGGTKIYLNTIDPYTLRDRMVAALYRLRDAGAVADSVRIAKECACRPNSLRYNPNLR